MSKSLTELRGIAQAIGAEFTFADNAAKLQLIIERHVESKYKPPEIGTMEPEDLTLRTRPPAKNATQVEIVEYLKDYIAKGLTLKFPCQDQWHMDFKGKSDSGNIRMPPRVIVGCAKRLMA